MNRHTIFKEIERILDDKLALARRTCVEYQEEAKRHVGAMESRYDTFKEEAQYLAAAQESQIAGLVADAALLREFISGLASLPGDAVVRPGSVISLKPADGAERNYVLAPAGGGIQFVLDEDEFVVITPTSPLGRVMLAKAAGDTVELHISGAVVTYTIAEIF